MRWFVVLVLFLGWSTASLTSTAWAQDAPRAPANEAACVGCRGTERVNCPTCNGTGKGKTRCALCDGSGRYACPDRTDLRKETSFFARLLGRNHEGTERSCPNVLCENGRVAWDDGKSYACKPCGGRTDIKCATCKLTQKPCPICNGKRKVAGVCPDCTLGDARLCRPPGLVLQARHRAADAAVIAHEDRPRTDTAPTSRTPPPDGSCPAYAHCRRCDCHRTAERSLSRLADARSRAASIDSRDTCRRYRSARRRRIGHRAAEGDDIGKSTKRNVRRTGRGLTVSREDAGAAGARQSPECCS